MPDEPSKSKIKIKLKVNKNFRNYLLLTEVYATEGHTNANLETFMYPRSFCQHNYKSCGLLIKELMIYGVCEGCYYT